MSKFGGRQLVADECERFLERVAKRRIPYCLPGAGERSSDLDTHPIHRVTEAPERLMEVTRAAADHEDGMFTETNPTADRRSGRSRPHQLQRPQSMSGSGYPKFRNDRGV